MNSSRRGLSFGRLIAGRCRVLTEQNVSPNFGAARLALSLTLFYSSASAGRPMRLPGNAMALDHPTLNLPIGGNAARIASVGTGGCGRADRSRGGGCRPVGVEIGLRIEPVSLGTVEPVKPDYRRNRRQRRRSLHGACHPAVESGLRTSCDLGSRSRSSANTAPADGDVARNNDRTALTAETADGRRDSRALPGRSAAKLV